MKFEYPIDTIITKSGDTITFMIVTVNNKPWFRITQDSKFTSSSYYDGDSLEQAKKIYCDLKLVFEGIKAMENFSKKNLNNIIDKCDVFNKENNNTLTLQQMKSDPLFLGMNDF